MFKHPRILAVCLAVSTAFGTVGCASHKTASTNTNSRPAAIAERTKEAREPHRVYNLVTGNFETEVPHGPRSIHARHN